MEQEKRRAERHRMAELHREQNVQAGVA
jgi:hypothetical protein